jgi:hypothetical protein
VVADFGARAMVEAYEAEYVAAVASRRGRA